MFTQCPSCSTVYEVSANDLAVGRGKVRCGFCETTFDALVTLSEDAPLHGTTLSGLPAPAILMRQGDHDNPGLAAAETLVTVPVMSATEPASAQAAPATAEQIVEGQPAPPSDAPPAEAETATASGEALPPAPTAPAQAQGPEPEQPSPRFVIVEVPGASSGGPDGNAVSAAVDVPITLDLEVFPSTRRTAWSRVGWTVAASLLALGLTAQLVHRGRDQLLQQPSVAPYLHRLYGALGIELDPHWEVALYKVTRRPELATEQSTDGEHAQLRLAATIMNSAARPQPYPLIRLTLEDRWGAAVAGRDFAPSEYLHDAARAARMLEPGERAAVNLLVIDPGADTVGFTIDICLADAAGTVHCANDASGS